MLKKLRVKFVCINMLLVTAMLLVIFGMLFGSTRDNLESQSVRMMEQIAAEPFRLGSPDEEGDGMRLPYFVLQIGLRGTVIATGGGYFDLSDGEFLEEVLAEALSRREQSGILKEYGLRFYRTGTPTTQTLVFADTSSEQAILESLVRNLVFIGAASFLAFLGVSVLLARWAVKPVEQAWKQQKQFVSDASHELKTPLTVIMTNAELLRDAPEEAARSRFTDNILTMSRQMRGLVESLLELARGDNGSLRMAFETVDLSGLAQDAALPFEPLFFERGLELESQLEPDITVRGSEGHLRQVMEILLDNAMKYADAPSTVRFRLVGQGRTCLLSVASAGQEISRADLKNIFKRFYRVDQARAMSGSYGLGLSIAEQIVQSHRGKIWAESAGGVNTFYVQLPLQ